MNNRFISFFGLKIGNMIKSKTNVTFYKDASLDYYSETISFPGDTCFIVLELGEIEKSYIGKERLMTVFYNNEKLYRRIDHGSFPLVLEVIL